MRVSFATIILCVPISLPTARAAETPGTARDENEAIRKGLAYVEGKSLNWLRERKCASCHHVPMMVWAQRDARMRGFAIDEKGLQEATDFLLAPDNRASVVPNAGDPDRPGNPYSLLAVYTTLADATAPNRMRVRQWLAANSKREDPQALSLRILIGHERQASVEQLLKRQNDDDGWSQTKEMASDAYATGQAIYALVSRGGTDRSHPAIVKSRNFLVKSQQSDGSWLMTSRPPNNGNGTGGAGNLEPITVASSAWAVLGLLRCIPPESP